MKCGHQCGDVCGMQCGIKGPKSAVISAGNSAVSNRRNYRKMWKLRLMNRQNSQSFPKVSAALTVVAGETEITVITVITGSVLIQYFLSCLHFIQCGFL